MMRELHDYSTLLDEVPKVYDHVTGSRASKPNTDSNVICSLADEHYQQIFEEEN